MCTRVLPKGSNDKALGYGMGGGEVEIFPDSLSKLALGPLSLL